MQIRNREGYVEEVEFEERETIEYDDGTEDVNYVGGGEAVGFYPPKREGCSIAGILESVETFGGNHRESGRCQPRGSYLWGDNDGGGERGFAGKNQAWGANSFGHGNELRLRRKATVSDTWEDEKREETIDDGTGGKEEKRLGHRSRIHTRRGEGNIRTTLCINSSR